MNITVGITAFNEGKLLVEAWDSVINQDIDSWEAVMVLDGGADQQTRKYFESIQHPKLKKYSYNTNQGPYGTRTRAIELSNTEWYCQLDGDDLLPSNAVNDIIEIINKHPHAEFIFGDCEHFSNITHMVKKPIFNDNMLCYATLFNGHSPISKNLFHQLGGYAKELKINADWDFWLSVHEKEIRGAYTNTVIYKWRIRKNNVGHNFMHLRPEIIDKIIKRHPLFFNNDERKNLARFNVLEKLARYYRSIGDRDNAVRSVKKAIQYGNPIPVFDSIIRESEMSTIRYYLHRLRRIIYFKL